WNIPTRREHPDVAIYWLATLGPERLHRTTHLILWDLFLDDPPHKEGIRRASAINGCPIALQLMYSVVEVLLSALHLEDHSAKAILWAIECHEAVDLARDTHFVTIYGLAQP